MIYLGSDLQQKIIPLFHYALRSGGYLFLGPSESVSSHKELFQTLNKKHRIFKRKETVPRPVVALPSPRDISRPMLPGGVQAEAEPNISKQLERIILQRYRPACVTVKENGDAVFFSGGIGRYLEPALGMPSVNVISMAREGLRIPLRTALYKAVTTRERVVQQVPVQTNGSTTQIDLTVEPIAEFAAANLFMIVFEDVAPAASMPREPFDAKAEETIRHLEGELRAAHDQAQAMFEELESSNEELKSANEEYQSTNEELETSKEEAQSTNEELETVNNELTRRITELDHSNSDLQNLNNGTQIATIFLDSGLHIRNFTPAAGSVFHLIAGDIGRPITDLAAQFAGVDLIVDIKEVLGTLATRERDLPGAGGRHYLVRIIPYRTIYNVIDGVVITFTDVTQLKQTEQVAEDAKEYAESIVETVREPLLVLDSDLRVKSANAAFFKMFQMTEDATLNQFFYELGDRQWDIPSLRALLGEILTEKKRVEDFLVEQQFPNIGPATMLLNASQISRRNGAPPLILLAIEDITARNRAEDALRQANRDLQYFAYAASHDLQEPIRMVTSYSQLLAREFKGQLGTKGDQFIEFALEGALRMEALLNGLRDYWAINEEKVEPSVVADGNYALQEALKLLDVRVQESGAIITHDPLPTVRAEDLPLILLFQNLVGNALKFVREGATPRIHVSVQRDAGEWHFSVQDNGVGIDAKHLKVIFVPFKRLHGQKLPGSGLGLAICQRIVERYKGRIWVESEGQGSTFHFMIPP
jgi:two-component system CheB/CheR fusion protein